MGRLLFRRARQTVIMMLLASAVIFGVVRLIPGDPAALYVGDDASPEVLAAVTAKFGLDRPLVVQYWYWLKQAVQGDLGVSYRSGIPVADLVARTFPATLELAVAAFVLAAIFGLTTGTIAALRPRTAIDSIITTINSAILGIPGFWIGILLVLTFSLWLRVLPAGGRVSIFENPIGGLRSLILPAFALSLNTMAIFSRFMRSSLLGTLQDDYIRTAVAKGVRYPRVVIGHAMRNAMIPVITVMGVSFGRLLEGAVVIESVFAWPGVGRLIVQSIGHRDYLVVQALVLLLVLIFLVVNFLVDISYGILDPRIKVGEQRS
jgi:ABC-type dipeptide/oligopeptide/nickel transport system permease component